MSQKKDKNKKKKSGKLYIIWVILLLAVIAVCLWKVAPYYWNNYQTSSLYEKLREQNTSKNADASLESAWKGATIDFEALEAINPDVMAWIVSEDTDTIKVDYPVLYAEKEDEQYLHNRIDGKYAFEGSIFVLNNQSKDFSDIHTTIYGHNMRNQSMFGSLKLLKEGNLSDGSYYFDVYTKDAAYRFKIFSAFTTSVNSEVYTYGYEADTDEYEAYIEYLKENTDIDVSEEVTRKDKTITLSTCTGSSSEARFTVHAVCVDSYQYEK